MVRIDASLAETCIQKALGKPLIAALIVGSLASSLVLILTPVGIYYLTGLATVETFDYTSNWLYNYWGPYIYGQAAGVGAVAGVITYGLRMGLLTKAGVKQGSRIGLFGAFFGFFSSLVYICCAPLILSLVILIGSSPILYLVRYNEELATAGLAAQAAGVLVAVLGMARAKKKACCIGNSTSHRRRISLLRLGGLSSGSLAVLGLIGIVVASAVAVNFIPEPALKSGENEIIVTGALEVHVFDASGNTVPATVRISGPLISQESSEAGIFFFPRLQPGSYKITVTSPSLQAAEYKTNVIPNQATHIVFELNTHEFHAYEEYSPT